MGEVINVTFFSTLTMTIIEKAENKDRTARLDWIIPTVVNLLLIVITTLILVSLIHYGLTTGKWRDQSTIHVDKLNAGVVYSFLIVCGILCIVRYIVNQIYINAGFNSDKDDFCEAAGDAAFISYFLILWSAFMFLWFRQKAFYSNNMLAFRTTKFIRALSYSSVFFMHVSAIPYVLFSTVPKNYEASGSGCLYKADKVLKLSFGIYTSFLIVFWQLVLLCLFIYPVFQIGGDSKSKKFSCFDPFFSSKRHLEKKEIAPIATLSSTNSTSSFNLRRGSSLTARPSDDEIKQIIQKTVFFAVASTLLDVILSLVSYFMEPPTTNWRFHYMMNDVAAFCNLLFLILSFSTYKRMLMSCFSRKNFR